jgi:hypothetical protein
MSPRIRTGTRLWLGGLAAGGVAAAHALAFLLVAPDPARRQQLLDSTGHGGWPLVVSVAMGALVVGLAGFAAGSLRRGRRAWIPSGTAGRLILLQGIGFFLLEGLERLATGKGLGALIELPFEPVMAVGLVLQVLLALAGAMLLALLGRIIVTLAGRLRSRPRAPRTLVASGFLDISVPSPQVEFGRAEPRGPPVRT